LKTTIILKKHLSGYYVSVMVPKSAKNGNYVL
jgi:hypothetical protein